MATNEVVININANTAGAERGFTGMRQKLNDLSGPMRRAGLGLTALGAAGTLMAKNFVGAALEQQRAERTLAAVVKQTGESWDSQRQSILDATAALQAKTNFGDEEQLRVLTQLIPILGSTERAMEALPAIMDASSASGRAMSSVAVTLGRALAGQANTAESVGLTFEETANFSERLSQVLGAVGGAAEANADPFTQLGNTIGDLKEQIGAALIPILEPFVNLLKSITEALQSLDPTVMKVVAALGLAVTAFAAIGGPMLLLIGYLPSIAGGLVMVSGKLGTLNTALIAPTIKIGVIAATVAALQASIRALISGDNPLDIMKRDIQAITDMFLGFITRTNKAAAAVDVLTTSTNALNEQQRIQQLELKLIDMRRHLQDIQESLSFTLQLASPDEEDIANLTNLLNDWTEQIEETERELQELKDPLIEVGGQLSKLGVDTVLLNHHMKVLMAEGLTATRAFEEANIILRDTGQTVLPGVTKEVEELGKALDKLDSTMLTDLAANTYLLDLAISRLATQSSDYEEAAFVIHDLYAKGADILDLLAGKYDVLTDAIGDTERALDTAPHLLSDVALRMEGVTRAAQFVNEGGREIGEAYRIANETWDRTGSVAEILSPKIDFLADNFKGLGDRVREAREELQNLQQAMGFNEGLQSFLSQTGQIMRQDLLLKWQAYWNSLSEEQRDDLRAGGWGYDTPPPSFRPSEMLSFEHGGVVPGPIGSPQPILAHGGETVLPNESFSAQQFQRQLHLTVNIDGREVASVVGLDAEDEEQVRSS